MPNSCFIFGLSTLLVLNFKSYLISKTYIGIECNPFKYHPGICMFGILKICSSLKSKFLKYTRLQEILCVKFSKKALFKPIFSQQRGRIILGRGSIKHIRVHHLKWTTMGCDLRHKYLRASLFLFPVERKIQKLNEPLYARRY
jgi:hypothetical protein